MKTGKRKSSYKSLQTISKRADKLAQQTGRLYVVWWSRATNRWKMNATDYAPIDHLGGFDRPLNHNHERSTHANRTRHIHVR